MINETYRIAEDLVPTLMERLAKIQKKASKLGSLPLSVREVGSDVEESANGPYRVRLFQIHGSAPKALGWDFVATLDHTVDAGVIIRSVPGEALPEAYRTAEPVCDHCQTVRRRKETFIVRNDQTGDMKQVGRQCVRDFLGGNDGPEDVARMLQCIFDIESLVRDASNHDGSFSGIAVETGVNLQRFLSVTAAVIAQRGWVSRNEAYTSGKTATASHVTALFSRANRNVDRLDLYTHEQEVFDAATQYEQVAEEAIDWARSMRDKPEVTDYEHNIAVVAEGGIVTTKLAGIAASIVGVYIRNQARERERAVRDSMAKNSRPLGAIKERVEVTVNVLSMREMETQFGVTTLVKMITSEGCACCWFASTKPEIEPGKVYRLAGTIKAVKEFNGVTETSLTRCRIL